MKKMLALLLCAALCFITACTKNIEEGNKVTLYFIDGEKKNMVTVMKLM